jgi:hypothetical protein
MPYNVSDLPPSFGFKNNNNRTTQGYDEWFNYKGITYILKK